MRSPTCSSTARAVEISSSRAKTCAAGGSNALDQIWRPLCALYIRGDADSVSFKTYTTLQHQIDVQLPADPANVAASLEPLGRPARRHLQLSGAAQLVGDPLGEAIAEVILFHRGAEVRKTAARQWSGAASNTGT
jgi:hypothetical protein